MNPDKNFSPQVLLQSALLILEINRQLLHVIKNSRQSSLERMNLLIDANTAVDEFFENYSAIMIDTLKVKTASTQVNSLQLDKMSEGIRHKVGDLLKDQYELLNEHLLPALERKQISFLQAERWNQDQRKWLYEFFLANLYPVLGPIGLDIMHPFPRVTGNSLWYLISLKGEDDFGKQREYAVLPIPPALVELVHLPAEISRQDFSEYVLATDLVESFCETLFPGLQVTGMYQFRAMRRGRVDNGHESKEVSVVVDNIRSRQRDEEIVRLEISHHCPERTLDFLCRALKVNPRNVYRIEGPINIMRLKAALLLNKQETTLQEAKDLATAIH